jgi:hypothetical protein
VNKERIALFVCASHHQGCHSSTGMVIAEALGIKFPITMQKLTNRARKDGLDPKKLWPWLYPSLVTPAEGK